MKEGPNRPEPIPISLDVGTAAAVVLDLSTRCHDPSDVCSKLMHPVGEFLERVRTSGIRAGVLFSSVDRSSQKYQSTDSIHNAIDDPYY